MLENPFKPNTPIEKTSPRANEKLVAELLGEEEARVYAMLETSQDSENPPTLTKLTPEEERLINEPGEVWEMSDYIKWAQSIGKDDDWVERWLEFDADGTVRTGAKIDIISNADVVGLPPQLRVVSGLEIINCKSFTHLPEDLFSVYGVSILDCPAFERFEGFELIIDDSLWIRNCPMLKELPITTINGHATFDACGLESLGSIHVKGELRISGCASLTDLPDTLHVKGDVWVQSSLVDRAKELQESGNIEGEVYLYSA